MLEASTKFKRLRYSLCILAGFLLLALAFFIVNRSVLYITFRAEAQQNADRLTRELTIQHQLVTRTQRKGLHSQPETPLGLRGTKDQTIPWPERLHENAQLIDANAASMIADDLANRFPVNWLICVDKHGRILSVFPEEMPKYQAEQLLQQNTHPDTWNRSVQTGEITFASQFSYFGWGTPDFTAIVPHTIDGEVLYTFILSAEPKVTRQTVLNAVAVATAGGFLVVLIAGASVAALLWRNLKERWQTTKTIRFLAHNDPLTHLPNRALFHEQLTNTLRKASITAADIYVIAVDVDKFKEINDTHGHAAGDVFLQVIADRLRLVFDTHLVARLSGDEFAVMVEDVTSDHEVTLLVERLMSAIKPPCHIEGKNLDISLSLGIAKATDAAWRTSRLLHCADMALYRTKTTGRSGFTWYEPSMDEDLQRRKILEAEMRKALKEDGFSVQYQAQVSLSDKKLKGFEALLRWNHPDRGWISPDVFIPLAEDTGLIEQLGEYVLRKACADAASWADPTLKVAVNFSPSQFKTGEIEQKIDSALRAAQLSPDRLEIEITENLLIKNTQSVVSSLTRIRQMGVSVAMDDFGTGYSSLSYLSKFPFDKIKIDRTFIRNLGTDAHTDAIVASIIGLGRSLDVLITAEGVENESQRQILRAAGCDLVQGFLFGRPRVVDPRHPFEGVDCLQNRPEKPAEDRSERVTS